MKDRMITDHLKGMHMEPEGALSKVGTPLFCDLIVSHKCFFNCQMCIDWKTPASSEMLTFDACKKFIDSLADFIDYRLDINIMGGEPLMLDWILPLCDHIHRRGFHAILSTNAYLIDSEMAKKIADSHVGVLGISLDGMKAQTHDAIRGVKGSHKRLMDALGHLKKHRNGSPHICILTLMLEKNLGELPDLVRWVNESGAADSISFLALLESGLVHDKQGWFRQPEYKHLWPQDLGKVKEVIDILVSLKKQGCKIVNPFSQFAALKEYYQDPEKFLRETEYCIHDYIIDLDPTSEVLLSGHRLCSLKENINLKQLWFSEKANQIRRYIDAYGCDSSRSCLINFLCAFPLDGDEQFDHYGNLGLFYQMRKKYDQALLHFKKAIERNPRNAVLHLGAAYNYLKLKDYQAALDEYNEAFKLNPVSRKEVASNYEEALEGTLKSYADQKRDLYR